MKKKITILSLSLLFLLAAMPAGATVRYVKAGASGDGSSWASAMGSLQTAINESAAGDEVWVAEGTYTPEELIKSSKPLSRAFMLKDGVSIYGGFEGTETSKEERAQLDGGKPYVFLHETILSADDDVPDTWVREFQDGSTYRYAWRVEGSIIPGTAKNYNHVLYAAAGITQPTEINGLTLKGAHASDYRSKAAGGALYAKGNVTLRRCKVVENSAWFKNESTASSDTNGGAVYLDGTGGATIEQCLFARNYSHSSYGRGIGGAVYAKNTTISECEFEDCVALDMGGAVYNAGGTVSDCTFTACYGGSGGAIYNDGTAKHNVIYECRGLLGGGIYNCSSAAYNIVADCYADMIEMGEDNGGKGGGVYNERGDLFGSVVFNNTSFAGGGVFVKGGRVINCTVQNNMLRTDSDEANIGFENKQTGEPSVLNTIGNPNAGMANFNAPTAFAGVAKNAADSAAVKEADWSLAAGSEFIDAGTPTDGINEETDIAGNPRVAGNAIDRGAYESAAEMLPNITLTYAEAGKYVTVGTGGSNGVKFSIDWGDGQPVEYSKAAYISHTTLGKVVKIYGDNLLILAATNQEIEAVDITKSPSLGRVQVGGNMITALDVSNNPNLTGIYCEKNKLKSIDVTNCNRLKVLNCSENEIEGTLDCSGLENLYEVNCSDNKIAELRLPKHEKLGEVFCSNNKLTALDVTGLTGLLELVCAENEIKSLNLNDNAEITEISAYTNQIDEIDVTRCAKLETLSLSENNLSSIDLRNNTLLTGLYIQGNNISELDITKCPGIKWLNADNNKLTEINTSQQADLSILNACNNMIREVDLSNNGKLLQVKLGGNKLSAIDVSNIANLSWLKVDGNNIGTLDLKHNAYLYWLECGDNKLTGLDLTGNKYLQRLEAGGNMISTMTIPSKSNLEGVLIQDNQLTADGINAIIESLKDVSNVEINVNNETWARLLNISGMPGTADADIEKATAKGWIVTAEEPTGIDTATQASDGYGMCFFSIDGHALGTKRPTARGIYIVKEMNGNRVSAVRKFIVR